MTSYCASRGLQIVDAYSSNHYLNAFSRFAGITDRALHSVAALSHDRLTADYNNLALMIRKPDDNSHD